MNVSMVGIASFFLKPGWKRGGGYGTKKGVYENKRKMGWGNSTKILEGCDYLGVWAFCGVGKHEIRGKEGGLFGAREQAMKDSRD